jgi:hypothetical protein
MDGEGRQAFHPMPLALFFGYDGLVPILKRPAMGQASGWNQAEPADESVFAHPLATLESFQ